MIAASLGEESSLMEGIELGEGIDGCCDCCFDDCECGACECVCDCGWLTFKKTFSYI